MNLAKIRKLEVVRFSQDFLFIAEFKKPLTKAINRLNLLARNSFQGKIRDKANMAFYNFFQFSTKTVRDLNKSPRNNSGHCLVGVSSGVHPTKQSTGNGGGVYPPT
ncbi:MULTISPECIES: hypothetical protein [Prochlorococcus]|uniref:hypothetical protein n=1 Tax=Prochlorococcus TaxID=1218 RepID=UPI000533B864|nr:MULTISPECIES: hypothetical protein [Prochlorococcus]KGG13249.1 hypothetical protein EV05_0928 [Prochlorococcus sp. MIT 0601]